MTLRYHRPHTAAMALAPCTRLGVYEIVALIGGWYGC
jgi:hypothetical protein